MPDSGERTPDRLQEFRAQNAARAGQARSNRWAFALLIVGLAAVLVMQGMLLHSTRAAQPRARAAGLDPETTRTYAAYLAEKNLPQEAIAAYESYLSRADLTPDARARICLGIAKLAMEQKQHEQALANLYLAEMLAPESDIKSEIDKRIVQCLDVLGRSSDLRRELKNRTSLQKTAKDVKPGETVLAECAGQVITDRDLDARIDQLPASMRANLDTPDKREELLKTMVAERMLLDKALRQGLDEDAQVQEQLAQERDALIVRKLIDQEVRSKISLTPEDVERYYKAEPARFTEPARAKIRYAAADTKEAAEAIAAPAEKEASVIEDGAVPGLQGSETFAQAILAASAGDRVGPVEVSGRWYVAKVEEKRASRLLALEDVRDRAQRMLAMQKEQEQMQTMLDDILKSQDVELHLDRLRGSGEEAPAAASQGSAEGSA